MLSIGCATKRRAEPEVRESRAEPSKEAAQAMSGDKQAVTRTDNVQVRAIRGTVVLDKGQTMPEIHDPKAFGSKAVGERPKSWPSDCPSIRPSDSEALRLGKQRGLGQVLISVTGFARAPQYSPSTRLMVIESCRLQPRFVVAVRSDRLKISNRSDYPFLPKLKSDAFMQAILPGSSREVALDSMGMQSIVCGFGAPCGRSDLLVLGHPVFALTDEDGRFVLPNVPIAGRDDKLWLHAWHPVLSESKVLLDAGSDDQRLETIAMKVGRQARSSADENSAQKAPESKKIGIK